MKLRLKSEDELTGSGAKTFLNIAFVPTFEKISAEKWTLFLKMNVQLQLECQSPEKAFPLFLHFVAVFLQLKDREDLKPLRHEKNG